MLTILDLNGCEQSMVSPVYLSVPGKTTAYEILKQAAKINPNFQFKAKKFFIWSNDNGYVGKRERTATWFFLDALFG